MNGNGTRLERTLYALIPGEAGFVRHSGNIYAIIVDGDDGVLEIGSATRSPL